MKNLSRSVDQIEVAMGRKIVAVDIAVVGFGGAGSAAAIEAADAGCEVAIFEKADEGGGSTRESGGSLRQLNDVTEAVRHFEAITMGHTPTDMLETFSRDVPKLVAWLEGMGAVIDEFDPPAGYPPLKPGSAFPELPGADALGKRLRVRKEYDGQNGGEALWNVLESAVRSRHIQIHLNTAASRLLVGGGGRTVVGVLCTTEGGEVEVLARQGVILTCGGFAYNPEMHKDYFGTSFNAFGPPGRNTGDGVRMAQAVGADLWHMNGVAGPFGYKFAGYEAAFMHRMPAPGYIYVDRRARRYMDETGVEFHACSLAALEFDPAAIELPRIPSYVIFDESTREAGPIFSSSSGWNRHVEWSPDNSVEVAKGWIAAGSSIGELARQLALPPSALEDTVRLYNSFCADERDPLQNRASEYLVPVERAPFYGVALWPTLLNTQGGPRRNAHAQVLDPFGDPIPHLFSAGELGSMWGMLYPGAGNISEALVFGRIAGRGAALETEC